MIPQSNWKWFGHPGHLCVSTQCRFHLNTRVGQYIISTVGDYFPRGSDSRETIGAGRDDYFETIVFECGPMLPCGCNEIAGDELHCQRYADAASASAGHMQWCLEYAELQEATDGPTQPE